MGNIEHWLAANREHIWPMKDEDDYTEGDTVICVAINENGNVSVVVVPTDPNRGAVDLLRELADEAAKAVCEPNRFDQQALSAVVTRARHHLRGQ
jgi:flavoprotein